MSEGHKIGVTRAIKGMMCVKEQETALIAAGVNTRAIWRMGQHSIDDIVTAFRPGNDVLVVAFLGILGKHRYDLLNPIAAKGASLLDLSTNKSHDISQAATFAEISKASCTAQTSPARASAINGPNKVGRKPKLRGKQLAEIKAAWQSPVGSNVDIASDYGVSLTWLHNHLGARKVVWK
ncbi:MAG: hypothetical protein JKY34_07470 [Kordiimonadaceae bacterium]|nr:hypothetical protein [Kordiimonadaceae bacterium]